jgi:hypothetical protein
MYHDRKIRFLYPPFIFMISILIGLFFDPNKNLVDILPFINEPFKIYELILTLIGGSVFTLVLGFIIEVMTLNIIKFFSLIIKKRSYTAAHSLKNNSYVTINKLLLPANQKSIKRQNFYAAITFEGAIVPKETHDWIVRRWTSFNVSSSSILALVSSTLPLIIFDIKISFWWIVINVIIGFFLTINAINSWYESKEMLDFLASCDLEKINRIKSN